MPNPVVVIHGWSDDSETFEGLGRFIRDRLDRPTETIDLADWISLNDQVTYTDLRRALQRAWDRHDLPQEPYTVDVVIHSTGALLVRDWMTTYFTPTTVPIERFLMLAPANYGSPLAHKGRGFLGRIVKGYNTDFETGTHILKGLELASPFTWELARRDVFPSDREDYWYGHDRVLATVLVGNSGYGGVRAAANEPGSDGTVRVSTANLDAEHITYDFRQQPGSDPIVYRKHESHRPAFRVVDDKNHETIHSDLGDRELTDLISGALSVERQEWGGWCDRLDAETEAITLRRSMTDGGKPRRKSYHHAFQNSVVRLRDDGDHGVSDYFLEFKENDDDNSEFLGRFFHEEAIRTVHAYGDDASYRSILVDVTELRARIDREGETLEVKVYAHPQYSQPRSPVGYREVRPLQLGPGRVHDLFAPHRTVLFDLVLPRSVADRVFELRRLEEN